jgi:hypothetical protein
VQIFPENGEKIREIGTDKIEISNGKGAFFCGFFSVFVCFLRFFYVFFPNFDFFLLIFICFFAHFLLIFYYFIYIYTEMVEIGPFSRVFPPFFPDSAVLKWLFAENLIHPALFSASKAENSHFSAENGSKTPQNGSKTPKMAENSAEIDSGLVILIVNHPNPVKMAVSIAKMAGKWLLAPESAENDRKTAENDRKIGEWRFRRPFFRAKTAKIGRICSKCDRFQGPFLGIFDVKFGFFDMKFGFFDVKFGFFAIKWVFLFVKMGFFDIKLWGFDIKMGFF